MTLTRDEIENMTAQELRTAIANAKGWSIYHYDKAPAASCYYLLWDAEGDAINPNYRENERKTEAECWEKDCPNWPADIAAAWELVEEIAASDYFCRVTTPAGPGQPYLVKIDRKGWGDNNPPPPGGWWQADTALLVICRAYLAWKSSNVR
jgi:hypothetical protein